MGGWMMIKKLEFAGWQFTITRARLVLMALAALGIGVIAVRFITGFGQVTNLSDDWPWGLWITFDVLIGVALAGGGYFTALIVHVLHQERYLPIARSAMLTSLIGYLLVLAGLLVDIGQWFNFWRPYISWGYTSVLFEVFLCISAYTTIQILEFGEIVTERIGVKRHNFFVKIMPILIVTGIIFPTLHQSSLGGLYLIAVNKLYPLWWSPLLPVFFFMSSFFVGPAMICVESTFAGRAFQHSVPIHVLRGLGKIGGGMMILYFLLKLYDLASRGILPLLLKGNLEGTLFIIEMVFGIIIPVIMIFTNFTRTHRGLFFYGLLVSAGVVLNRVDVSLVGMAGSASTGYFPTIWEFVTSIGFTAIGCLLYCFIAENFHILGHENTHDHVSV
jgi:Ni/Fe-hydrogenase subunit HybB-like protein